MSNHFEYVTGLDKAMMKGKQSDSEWWTFKRDESVFHPLIFRRD